MSTSGLVIIYLFENKQHHEKNHSLTLFKELLFVFLLELPP